LHLFSHPMREKLGRVSEAIERRDGLRKIQTCGIKRLRNKRRQGFALCAERLIETKQYAQAQPRPQRFARQIEELSDSREPQPLEEHAFGLAHAQSLHGKSADEAPLLSFWKNRAFKLAVAGKRPGRTQGACDRGAGREPENTEPRDKVIKQSFIAAKEMTRARDIERQSVGQSRGRPWRIALAPGGELLKVFRLLGRIGGQSFKRG
jgi:hypothetical protein